MKIHLVRNVKTSLIVLKIYNLARGCNPRKKVNVLFDSKSGEDEIAEDENSPFVKISQYD